MEIKAYYSPCRDAIEFFIGDRKGDEFYVSAPTEFVFSKKKPGEAINPAFSLSRKEANFLLQQLWDTGLRPNNAEGQQSAQDSIDRAEAGVEDCIDRLEEALRYIKSSLDSIKELKGEA